MRKNTHRLHSCISLAALFACLAEGAADLVAGIPSYGNMAQGWHFRTTTCFSLGDFRECCDRQIPFSISWWKLAEVWVVWLQWSSKDWRRAIKHTLGLPFWISGLIVEKTCTSDPATTPKQKNNQPGLKGLIRKSFLCEKCVAKQGVSHCTFFFTLGNLNAKWFLSTKVPIWVH